jgi:hypothetical protein
LIADEPNPVVRTPAKLYEMLAALQVPDHALQNLVVVPGSVADAAAVRRTLLAGGEGGFLADYILSGIGCPPQFHPSLSAPVTVENGRVCEQAATGTLDALRALAQTAGVAATPAGRRPVLLAMSTAGVADRGRDVPVAFMPFYHIALAEPHKDKKIMEELVTGAPSTAKGSPDALIEDFVIVRPSLLMDGAGKGLEHVRVGWELPGAENTASQAAPDPAIGYTIQRGDVGNFMIEKVVQGNGEYHGKMVSLTY